MLMNEADPLEQAADWQIRLHDSTDPNLHAEFEHWLHSHAAHLAAWQSLQRLWETLEPLPASAPSGPPALASGAGSTQPQSKPRHRSRRWPALAWAAGLAALAVLIAPQATLAWRADYLTAQGETRRVQLADGSTLTLAPDTAVAIADDNPRQVLLLRGQAFFDVAPDPDHPFVATAGELSVKVLGTAFDLALGTDNATVALEHGQVLAQGEHAALSEKLAPGDTLRLSWPSGTVQRSHQLPSQIATWRQGSLFVEDMPVALIVEQLQRYSQGWILITDNRLKDRRLTGVFDLDDPDRALLALAQSLGAENRQITPWLRTLGSR